MSSSSAPSATAVASSSKGEASVTQRSSSSSSKGADASVQQQQQLWASLKLDPLLISHATGLHRTMHDVQQLRDKFKQFASHVLRMTNTGADLTSHLLSLYRAGTAPAGIQLMVDSHTSMAATGLEWFSTRFKNQLLNQFTDWLEDAESVLGQLGLVQKTRHELDGLQDAIEKQWSRKAEAPVWDAVAEASLTRRLETSKEKLAAACLLYDGQRRGVEKSMAYLLASRQQLFHQVVSCFMDFEHHFFRQAATNAAAFVTAYPYSPPHLEFAEKPFGDLNADDGCHSASALMLTLPYFQWNDPSCATGEGPNVKAIRHAMATKTRSASPADAVDAKSPSSWETAAAEWDQKQAPSVWTPVEKPTIPDERSATPPPPPVLAIAPPRAQHAAVAVAIVATVERTETPRASERLIEVVVSPALDADVTRSTPPERPGSEASIASSWDSNKSTSESTPDEKDQTDVFVSPQPLASSSSPPTPSPAPALLTLCRSESEMVQEMNDQAATAAALNLPAKLLPTPRPSAKLHPVLWAPVPLARVKGSVWSMILIEGIKFDNDDEMREEFALTAAAMPGLEQAFRTNDSFDAFQERSRAEQVRQPAAKTQRSVDTSDDSSSAPGVGRLTKNRFAHMKTIDGGLFSPPAAASSSSCFPASPYPGISAKQWYLAYQIFIRVLHPLTPAQVLEAVYRLDDKALDPTRVNALLRLMPNEKQRATIRALNRPSPLEPIEQLFSYLSLRTTPSLSLRLSSLHFQTEFGPLCTQVETSLDTIERCVLEVKKSHSLRILLAVLLNLGNHNNASHHVPPSYGFSLDFLPRVSQIPAAGKPHSTLLDFLVQHLSVHHPQLNLSSFSPSSFPHLAAAMRLDEWLLAMQLRYLEEEFRKVKALNDQDEFEKQNRSVVAQPPAASAESSVDVSPAAASSSTTLPFPVSSFPPRVPRFLSYVQARTTVLRHRYIKAKADVGELCRYLCVTADEVVDPAADSVPLTMPIARASSEPQAELGFAHLPPLGEFAPITAALDGAAPVQPLKHTRYDWQGALGVLHQFVGDFSQAHSNFAVAARTAKAAASNPRG